jgi:Bor protein
MKSQVRSLLRPPGYNRRVSLEARTRAGVLLACSVALTGCFTVTARTVKPRDASDPQVVTGSVYLWGLVGDLEVDVRDVCGSHPAVEIRTSGNAVTLLASAATLGLYTPRRVRIVCAGEQP